MSRGQRAALTALFHVAADAERGVHPPVGVQRWIQCMEDFGWSQKKKS